MLRVGVLRFLGFFLLFKADSSKALRLAIVVREADKDETSLGSKTRFISLIAEARAAMVLKFFFGRRTIALRIAVRSSSLSCAAPGWPFAGVDFFGFGAPSLVNAVLNSCSGFGTWHACYEPSRLMSSPVVCSEVLSSHTGQLTLRSGKGASAE